LNAIPTVGYSGILTSYITALKYRKAAGPLLEEGYTKASKFRGRPFKIATLSRWLVVLSGEEYVKDLCDAPEEVLSVLEPLLESTQAKHTFGLEMFTVPSHITTIRNLVTRNLGIKFDEIRDEVIRSCEDHIPESKDWVTVHAYATILHVVCRTANRYLLGLPICRDRRILALGEELSDNIIGGARTISLFPGFLKRFASEFLTRVPGILQDGYDIMAPIIEERLAQYRDVECEADNQPNDVLTWLIKSSSADFHLTAPDMARRVAMINLASMHATSMVLTQALYDLVIHPEYTEELREEIASVVGEDGWTKTALQKMRKLDSFLKESHRLNTVSEFLMVRQSLKSYTLSDGTIIPPGVHVGIASGAMNKSEEVFKDAKTFKGFRFAEMREGNEYLDSTKHQMVGLSKDTVTFGRGRHACPGRFFAVTVIKMAFVHILLNYDVRLENGSLERPVSASFEITTTPNTEARLMFRKSTSAALRVCEKIEPSTV
ncbi:hypothetical protein AGABI1DRAFT_35198, partial [Agaricus bisporus var. burnettii JB137-S8]